jgi:WD40 repeat protein
VDVKCLAVSKDGRWIAAGTGRGGQCVWDAQTYEQVISHERGGFINGVDFSPDSTRLVSASDNSTATVWDIATRDRAQTLDHGRHLVTTAKYSPQGNRIATATHHSVRVWDGNNGRVLVPINVNVTPWYNTGLLWLNNHLFVISDSTIKQFDAPTGSAVSEWPVPDRFNLSCITLPKHGKFIAYSSRRSVTFWDTATHTQLGLVQHPQDIHSIALSPDRFLAIGGQGGKIIISSMSRITVGIVIFRHDPIPFSPSHPTFQAPDIPIDDAALHSWKCNQLANAEALLTAAIHEPQNPSHYALAGRALVRARLRQWDPAIADATQVFVILLSHALSLIYSSPSQSSHLSLATSQRV